MTQQNSRTYFVGPDDVPAYSPNNHTGTVNRRLISPETVGSKHIEVLFGTARKGGAAMPHAHPGIEQVCYMIAGRARANVGGQSREIGAGECCFFPAGEEHSFTVVSDEPVQLLVIYSPPYGENPSKVVRLSQTTNIDHSEASASPPLHCKP